MVSDKWNNIIDNRIVDRDVERLYDFRINVRIVHNTIYLLSKWFDMIGMSSSWCSAFGHVNVM